MTLLKCGRESSEKKLAEGKNKGFLKDSLVVFIWSLGAFCRARGVVFVGTFPRTAVAPSKVTRAIIQYHPHQDHTPLRWPIARTDFFHDFLVAYGLAHDNSSARTRMKVVCSTMTTFHNCQCPSLTMKTIQSLNLHASGSAIYFPPTAQRRCKGS
jgi:hypothetical protein